MGDAIRVRNSAPRLLHIVPPKRTADRIIAELTASNAMLADRVDLLALYLARIDSENVALRDRCDILAKYLETLVALRAAHGDRETRTQAENDKLRECSGLLALEAERIQSLTITRRRRIS
jgi:hypothetical protein